MKKVLVLMLLLASGCGSVNPITVARLARLSPETADPANFQIMLVLPTGLEVPKGGAVLKLAAEREDTGETIAQEVALRMQDAALAGQNPGDGAARLFSVAPADLPRVRAFQARIRDWKLQAPRDTHGSMSVGVSGCSTGSGPAPDARVSVRIRIEKDGAFLPLASNAPLADILEQAGADGGKPVIGLCPDTAKGR